MAREVCSFSPLSGAAHFLRTFRLGWGLVCHVSAVSRGRSPGNCFPQLGPGSLSSRAKRLPAVLACPRSWWGGGLSSVTISQNCWSPLVELANTTSSVKGSSKRGIIVQARAASPSILEAFKLFMNGDARCGSKLARWRYSAFFPKEWVFHEIPEEPARRGSHTSASLCLDRSKTRISFFEISFCASGKIWTPIARVAEGLPPHRAVLFFFSGA
jgi:hypothetical protein